MISAINGAFSALSYSASLKSRNSMTPAEMTLRISANPDSSTFTYLFNSKLSA